jgi:hypothetical protein
VDEVPRLRLTKHCSLTMLDNSQNYSYCFIGAAKVLSRDSIESAPQPPITDSLSLTRINIVDQLDAKRASLFPKTQLTLWDLHIIQQTDRTVRRSPTSARNREVFSSLVQFYFHPHNRLKSQPAHHSPSDHPSPSDYHSPSRLPFTIRRPISIRLPVFLNLLLYPSQLGGNLEVRFI